jgi:hypothetical protein
MREGARAAHTVVLAHFITMQNKQRGRFLNPEALHRLLANFRIPRRVKVDGAMKVGRESLVQGRDLACGCEE